MKAAKQAAEHDSGHVSLEPVPSGPRKREGQKRPEQPTRPYAMHIYEAAQATKRAIFHSAGLNEVHAANQTRSYYPNNLITLVDSPW